MKKIFNFSLITVCVLGMILPGSAVFSSQSANTVAQNTTQSIGPKIFVSVAQAQPAGTVTVNNYSASAFATNCSGSLGSSGGILQNAGLINLNQPAGCFTLKVSTQIFEPAKLSVMPLAQPSANVVVVYHGPTISSGNLSKAPVKSETPIIPAVSFGLIIGFALVSRKRIFSTARAATVSVKESLTLHQLQMLRC